MSRIKNMLLPAGVVAAVIGLVGWAANAPVNREVPEPPPLPPDLAASVKQIDEHIESLWQREKLIPAEPADELQVLRRLSLVLHGTIPSLEEIREFEADAGPDRLTRWTSRLMADVRFADYFSERLARGYVGVEGGQFIVYRRDRFVEWLSEQLQQRVPYDNLVRQMISVEGCSL